MSLAIDNIKIKYSQEGYLPNYPPHLISDKEMCDAFVKDIQIQWISDTYQYIDTSNESTEPSYFYDHYLLSNYNLVGQYSGLVAAFLYHIKEFIENDVDLPNWVYSYMLGYTVNPFSDWKDRHYLLTGLNTDNIDDELDARSQAACLAVSASWINKVPDPTTKSVDYKYYADDGLVSISIDQIKKICTFDDQTSNWDITDGPNKVPSISNQTIHKIDEGTWDGRITPGEVPDRTSPVSSEYFDLFENGADLSDILDRENGHIHLATTSTRPPTMFGEPHVIKQLRLYEAENTTYIYEDNEEVIL